MRTNIVLNDDLVREAQALSQIKTKRELIETALKEFVAHRKQLNPLDLKGARLISREYDYRESRTSGRTK
jgi:Arc/MetJ family transcription regulator|tara:strand:+ start:515 stop:724 length:210 start_codon:yes stop_codon:yes gene_type:complete